MRKLNGKRHPDFDRRWPDTYRAIVTAGKMLCRKYWRLRCRASDFHGTLALLANHCLYEYDPDKSSFTSYLVRCALRTTHDNWVSRESEEERQHNAFQKSKKQHFFENEKLCFFVAERSREPTECEEVADALGAEFWDRLLTPLKPRQRLAVRLRYEKGLRFRQVADFLGSNENAVRRYVHNALGILRAKWSDDPTFEQLRSQG